MEYQVPKRLNARYGLLNNLMPVTHDCSTTQGINVKYIDFLSVVAGEVCRKTRPRRSWCVMSGHGTKFLCQAALRVLHVPDQNCALLEKSGRLFCLSIFGIDCVAQCNFQNNQRLPG